MVKLPHWPIPHGTQPIKLGFERVNGVLANLGNPQLKLPPVIHIAGTNGKGSTLAFMKSILEAEGYTVHRYSSPHIEQYNERIHLAGKDISDDYLHEIIEETRTAAGDIQPTFYEGTTAAAFLAFSRVPADVLLLETGLGGRLDATNVVDDPLLSIIAPISLDHMEYLGTTLAMIAGEKAGILKKGSKAVISWQYEETMQVLFRKCVQLDIDPSLHVRDWDFERTVEGFNFIDCNSEIAIKLPKPSLAGIHQYLNAATAVASILSIKETLPVSMTNIHHGIGNTYWPARLEHIQSGKLHSQLPEGFELWVDGAHNDEGAKMLAAHINHEWKDKPTIMINGRTGNRDIEGFLKYFKDSVKQIYSIRVESEPLAEDPQKICKVANGLGFEGAVSLDIENAVDTIIKKSNEPVRIIVCGSLYLAGDIKLANSR